MSKIVIKNNLPGKFTKLIVETADMVLNQMAIDIERLSKMQVPHKQGALQASGYHKKIGTMKYRVEYNKEYAEYQHEGQRSDGSRVVRNYTEPGTKKGFLIDPAKIITGNARKYLEAFQKIKVK